MAQRYYFCLQYSAIQKTVMRHDRLWSIAGISNILSRMNEIEMPAIAGNHKGDVIVAGGGKFTARFSTKDSAEKAKAECIRLIVTTLPMLEFQISEVHAGASFRALKDTDRSTVIAELGERKRQFRGYGITFNPHLQLCEECGEYPVQDEIKRPNKQNESKPEVVQVCRVCKVAFNESQEIHSEKRADTTLQKIYHGYLREVPAACGKEPAADFNCLFPNADDERKRMAVWFSDLNNMNDKVPVWLQQDDEDKILETFATFRATVVEIIVKAIAVTFEKPTGKFLPFRLVVAGGDDLCLVMAEKDILTFTKNISAALNTVRAEFHKDHPLSDDWLLDNGDFKGDKPKPFGFGGSFVVTSMHTPFRQIHQVGEELMSTAKKETDRQGNSVNWRIMAEDEAVTEDLLAFERPLFIEKRDQRKSNLPSLTFSDYLALRNDFAKISGSHRQQIIAIMQKVLPDAEQKNPWEIERQLKLLDAGEADKSFSPLLRDKRFRNSEDMLLPERIATLFELMTIAGGDSHE